MENAQNLLAEASILDAKTAAPVMQEPGQTETALPADPASEAADLIRFAVALFVPLYPSLQAVYHDAAQAKLAQAAGPVMAKYGLTMGGLFEKWGPEIQLAIVGVPLAIETGKAMRADNAARLAAAKKSADGEDEGRPG